MQKHVRPHSLITGLAALLLGACAETPRADDVAATAAAAPTAQVEERKPETRAGTLPGRVTRIALGDLFALQQSGDVLIYDVRPVFFHSLGHIPDSVNWPKSAFSRQLATREAEIRAAREADRPVVLYCTDMACPDARDVATRLAERGHHTRVLEGGWEAWKAGGLPAS